MEQLFPHLFGIWLILFSKHPIAITAMKNKDQVTSIEKYFTEIMAKETNLSAAIAAIKTLLMVLEETNCNSGTTYNIIFNLNHVSNSIFSCNYTGTAVGNPKCR